MTNLLIAAAILFGAYYLIRLFARTPPAQLARMVKTVAGVAALGFAGLMFIRGRIEFALAIGGVGLWLMGLGAPPGWLDQFRTAGVGRPSVSKVRSGAIQMELDHDTGVLDGRCSRRPLRGTPAVGLVGHRTDGASARMPPERPRGRAATRSVSRPPSARLGCGRGD